VNGEAIGSRPLAAAGLRALASEQDGPRPAGVLGAYEVTGARAVRRVVEGRTERATRP